MRKSISNSSYPGGCLSISSGLIFMNEGVHDFSRGFEESVRRDVVIIDDERVEVGFAY
jgi:hypothetical protein